MPDIYLVGVACLRGSAFIVFFGNWAGHDGFGCAFCTHPSLRVPAIYLLGVVSARSRICGEALGMPLGFPWGCVVWFRRTCVCLVNGTTDRGEGHHLRSQPFEKGSSKCFLNVRFTKSFFIWSADWSKSGMIEFSRLVLCVPCFVLADVVSELAPAFQNQMH